MVWAAGILHYGPTDLCTCLVHLMPFGVHSSIVRCSGVFQPDIVARVCRDLLQSNNIRVSLVGQLTPTTSYVRYRHSFTPGEHSTQRHYDPNCLYGMTMPSFN